MYKLSRRENLIPFVLLLGMGLGAVSSIPPMFPELVIEIPALTLFPAQVAVALIMAVLFFENASPPELIRIALVLLAITLGTGAFGNLVGRTTQAMPDSTILVNWTQLIIINLSGLVATLAYYTTRAPDSLPHTAVRTPKAEQPVAAASAAVGAQRDSGTKHPKIDSADIATGESAKEILDKLDVSRIESLEQSLKQQQPENVSLESLFAEESRAAAKLKDKKVEPERLLPEEPCPEAVTEDALAGEPAAEQSARLAAAESSQTSPATFSAEPAAPAAADNLSSSDAAAEPAPAGGKLFDDVSGDLDDIFAELAPAEAQKEFSPGLPSTPAEPVSPVLEAGETAAIEQSGLETAGGQPAASATETPKGGLFQDVSADLDDIFAELAPEAPQTVLATNTTAAEPEKVEPQSSQAVPPVAEPTLVQASPDKGSAPAQADTAPAAPDRSPLTAAPAKEVKEFGRLSAAASRTELAAPGTLKTIGQMLLDTQAVENIIKQADRGAAGPTTAKVVTVDRGADIQSLLNKIASFPGASGSLVIGKDGLLVGATESLGFMKDVLGPLSLAIQSTTSLGTKKLEMGELHQAVFQSDGKLTVLTEVGMGILAVYSDTYTVAGIDGLLEWINTAVADTTAMEGAPTAELSSVFSAQPPPPALAAATQPPANQAAPSEPPSETAAATTVDKPPEAPSATPSTPAPVQPSSDAPAASREGGLLNVSDDEIGGIFGSLVSDPAVADDALTTRSKTAQAAAAAAEPTSADQGQSELLNVCDQDVNDAFGAIMSGEEPEPAAQDPDKAPAAAGSAAGTESIDFTPKDASGSPPAQQPAASNPAAIKEFGRLSSAASATQSGQEVGTIKAIGRQLIDVQAVENIIKAGEKRGDKPLGAGLTTARVISSARGEGIKTLLQKIDTAPGVAGSLIVGSDGLVIASTLTGGLDKDLLGALCTAMHSHTELAAKKLDMGKLRQIIFHAQDKLTILTAVAVGVLAVFVEHRDLDKVDALLTAIEQTVRG